MVQLSGDLICMVLLSAEASSNEVSVFQKKTRALADDTNVASLDFCESDLATEEKIVKKTSSRVNPGWGGDPPPSTTPLHTEQITQVGW